VVNRSSTPTGAPSAVRRRAAARIVEQVARVGAGLGGRVVLLDGQAKAPELGLDGIRHGALAARGALDLAEAHEVVEQALPLGGRGALEGADGHAPEATGEA
jgi:hypothetical protein